jgi:hypothetical protein
MTRAKKTAGFIKLNHELMDSSAWRTASLGCRCIVLALWRRHTGKNNGTIPYGWRDARAHLGCGMDQVKKYLAEAQERGFIELAKRGSFDWKRGARQARTTTWRLTMERCEGREPTNEWRAWTPPENLNRLPERERYGSRSGNDGRGMAPGAGALIRRSLLTTRKT